MKERPILFSAPMVRAIQAGTKTQTRRIVKPRRDRDFGCELAPHELAGEVNDGSYRNAYCEPGDLLWVREAWRADIDHDHKPPRDIAEGSHVWYEADRGLSAIRGLSRMGKLRPGMFMPSWASRITLEVLGVRVESLRAITRGDAMAEGCPFPNMAKGDDPRQWYADLWDEINGPGSWDANPWVWVVEFKRVEVAA